MARTDPETKTLLGKLKKIRSDLSPEAYRHVIKAAGDTVEHLVAAYTRQPLTPRTEDIGEAYWVFNSEDDQDKIRDALSRAKAYARASPDLDIEYLGGYDQIPDDGDLRERAELQFKGTTENGPVHVVRGRMRNSTNEEVGRELGKICTFVFDTMEKKEQEGHDPFGLFSLGLNDDIYVRVGDRYFDNFETANWLPS